MTEGGRASVGLEELHVGVDPAQRSMGLVGTTWFRGHLCNDNNGPNKPRHRVWGDGWLLWHSVAKGKRSLITVWPNFQTFLRSTRYSQYYAESGIYRLGAMAAQ